MSDSLRRTQPAAELVERAFSFFAVEGWRYEQSLLSDSAYVVLGPEGELYIVVIHDDPQFSICTCPTFTEERECIHLLAVEYELHSLASIEAQELLQEAAEHPVFGTDPDYWIDRQFSRQ